MADRFGFQLIEERDIEELRTRALWYRHAATGAELLSLVNDDENKVFGVTFRTPPADSTGVPHILEHSVLCGSEKYPVKEPFVELLKGSLQTFLNAFTYPDKTCYPVASQNLKDFYNLIDVYLDAVFHPRLTPFIFQQEGWHLEMLNRDEPPRIKGVVYNEMKGAYSAPDGLLMEYSQHSLFPDNTYGLDSGGDPRHIPDLTYQAFMEFYQRHYHPSNARFYFYGDDDPDARLRRIAEQLDGYERIQVDSAVPLQERFAEPRRLAHSFAVEPDAGTSRKGMITVNWLLGEGASAEDRFALSVLDYILIGMPASPLRRALIESGLGEDLAGVGLENELRQLFFSTGMKGVSEENFDRVETLILDTLGQLSTGGIDRDTVEAAVNTIEFRLRENNSGSYPRGLVLMLRSLTRWLYDDDPIRALEFEQPLARLKQRYREEERYFEKLIEEHFIVNHHRATVVMRPDEGYGKRLEEEEAARVRSLTEGLGPEQIDEIIRNTHELQRLQETPDPPQALATIPTLRRDDLERSNRIIPLELETLGGSPCLVHDLFTNGIVYVDIGFDLHCLPEDLLPYLPLFGRALLEMGTEGEDYVAFTQRIRRKTGGIRKQVFTAVKKDRREGAAWLFLRGKAMVHQLNDLRDILADLLSGVRLDQRERFGQMLLEEKARVEHQVVPNGHRFVTLRLNSHFSESGWLAERLKGLTYLAFLQDLVRRFEQDWPSVLECLQAVGTRLLNRSAMVLNVTTDEKGWRSASPVLEELVAGLPDAVRQPQPWSQTPVPEFEGLVVPSQVNFVGKAAGLYDLGYRFHGSALVAGHYLRTSWLWDRVRVRGGAYGAFCVLDRFSGVMTFASYRDPNFLETLEVFDASGRFLSDHEMSGEELNKSVIGVIGDLDRHMLPDAKGFASLTRYLTGDDDRHRQELREQVLATSAADVRRLGEFLRGFKDQGLVKVIASRDTIERALESRGRDWLNVTRIL